MKKLYVVFISFVAPHLAAQNIAVDLDQNTSIAPKMELDINLVTANKVKQDLESTLVDVEIITSEQIQKMQAHSLTDVLRRLGGVQITQNGGRGQLALASIRGSDPSHVLVLVDGVRFVQSLKGAVDFNQLPLNYVDRIEYVKGARASLYGSDAIGGIINIITIANKKESNTKLSASIGSFDYYAGNVNSSISIDPNKQLNFSVSIEDTKGYNVHPVYGINDQDRHGFATNNVLLSYLHNFDNTWSASAHIRWYDNIYQYDSSTTKRLYQEGNKEDLVIGIAGNYDLEYFKSALNFTYQKQNSLDHEKGQSKNLGVKDNLFDHNINWLNTYVIDEQMMVASGIDWRRGEYFDHTAKNNASSDNVALFGFTNIHVDKALFEFSARVDNDDLWENKFTYNLATKYQFISELSAKASFATAFKSPNLYQLYNPIYGNKELKPEDAKQWELGLQGDLSYLSWSLVGYRSQIKNLIDFHPTTFQSINVMGSSVLEGVELELELTTGTMSHHFYADHSNATDQYGKRLSRRAQNTYKWNSIISFNQVDLVVGAQYVGKRSDTNYDVYPYQPVVLPSYIILDTSINYYIDDAIILNMRIDNVLDADYATVYGYPAPKRSYYFNVTYQF